MIFAGLALIALAAVASIPLFDQAALEWFTENSSCNDRPCTEDEARTIATVITAGGGVTGIGLLTAGLGRAVRGRGEAPDLSRDLGISDDDYGARMEALARLDEAYGRGQVDEQTYLKRKRKLMG